MTPKELLDQLSAAVDSLKTEGEDLKVKQAATQTQAKEAQTAWGEVIKEGEAFAKERPALETKRVELKATLDTLAQDLGKLPVADKLKDAFAADATDGDKVKEALKNATDTRDTAKAETDKALETVVAARKTLDDTRRQRDERKGLLAALEKALVTTKGALDKGQVGEGWMRWRLEIEEPELGKRATAALDTTAKLKGELEAAWKAWVTAMQDLGAKELAQAQAERPVAQAEAAVKDWESKRVERLLKRAAEIQAGG